MSSSSMGSRPSTVSVVDWRLANSGLGNTHYSILLLILVLLLFRTQCGLYPHSMEFIMSKESSKVGRTIRLTRSVNRRLIELCEHLGTNPNAYLVSEIGKSVARDEVAFQAVARTNALFEGMERQLDMALEEGSLGD